MKNTENYLIKVFSLVDDSGIFAVERLILFGIVPVYKQLLLCIQLGLCVYKIDLKEFFHSYKCFTKLLRSIRS